MPLNRYSAINSWMRQGSTTFVCASLRMQSIYRPPTMLEIIRRDAWKTSWGDSQSTMFQNIRFGLENSDFVIHFVFCKVQR